MPEAGEDALILANASELDLGYPGVMDVAGRAIDLVRGRWNDSWSTVPNG